jgi:hypothetical protein
LATVLSGDTGTHFWNRPVGDTDTHQFVAPKRPVKSMLRAR